MNKYKNIKNIFESWGKNKQELPLKNDLLKEEVLSKIPADFRRVYVPKRSPFILLPFAFTAMAVLVLLVNITVSPNGAIKQNTTQEMPTGVLSRDTYSKSSMPSVYPYLENGNELSISDNREFLKVGYNATLRTRNIANLKNRVETIVRGSSGRVDSSNSGEKFGYVSFAIPKSQLENFKLEIKDLVGVRFYVEETNSQNLLPQKQMIEENQRQAEQNLNNLQTERGEVVKKHNQNIYAYQTRINSSNTEINALNTEYTYATPVRKIEITNRISQLQTEINIIRSEMTTENKNYQTRINAIDAQIIGTQNNLKNIKTQDSNLIDSVATVNGSISLSWISLWEMADAYLPGPLLAWILFVAALITFLWYRLFIRAPYNSFDFS